MSAEWRALLSTQDLELRTVLPLVDVLITQYGSFKKNSISEAGL